MTHPYEPHIWNSLTTLEMNTHPVPGFRETEVSGHARSLSRAGAGSVQSAAERCSAV